MEILKKVLKYSVWSAMVFGPLFYFGAKAVPMVTESIEFTKKVSAKNADKREKRLLALEQVAAATDDGVNQAALAMTAEATDSANARLADAEAASQDGLGTASASEGGNVAKAEPKTITIESAYDPSDEARIEAMFIPEATKRAILENYRRTGVLPDALLANRQPSSARN
jgi:hypothetical protein